MVEVKTAADLLIAARRDGRKMEALPEKAEPKTLEDAYAIQDEIMKEIGLKLAGWKVALTNDEAMARAGATEPAAGPLFAPHIVESPQTLEGSSETVGGFECEFAFHIGKNIPAEGAPYTGQVIAAAVDSLHPAVEVVGIRIGNRPSLGVRGVVADHAGNFSFVYGPAVPNWEKLDLAKCGVRHLVDGKEVAASDGANVLGNPLNALAWLANHLAKRGYEIKAGQWVTSGAATGPIPAPPGSTMSADFGPLGSVEVYFKS
jgi:2-oxo-3-hexenedioate decarboxylase